MTTRNRLLLIVASVAWLIGAGLVLNKHVIGLVLPFGDGQPEAKVRE